jgi:hypothetical protein
MLKTMLMAGAALIALPAMAQDAAPRHKPKPAATAPQTTDAKPATAAATPSAEADAQGDVQTAAAAKTEALAPSNAPQNAAPSQPQTSQQNAQPAPAAQDATAAAPATATQPATTASQVAQVVQAEFPSYDKDKSGGLSKAEFGDWMGALRKASDANFNPASPEAANWSAQAFAAADTDKDGSVSQAELTAFLAKGKS